MMPSIKRLLASAGLLVLVGTGCANVPAPAPQTEPAPAPVPAPASAPTPTGAPPAPPAKAPIPPVSVPNPGGIAPENREDRVVIFNGDGFDPANVAVHVGRKITWINQSKQNVWPASNPHPSHTDCPGFDAGTTIPPGESYTFTFTKAGICNYHNHLSTGSNGQVQVTPDPKVR